MDFSELSQFENVKIKNFSSGMYARLAFATAVAVEPDILLLDEVLAVGDEKFQMKCREKINNFKKSGATIVLVSHSLEAIQSICDRAILLEHGVMKASGNVWEVGEKYRGDMGIKQLAAPRLIAPLENEVIDGKEVTFSWDINNPLDNIEDIELRIREITGKNESKLNVLRFPKETSCYTIKDVFEGQELPVKKYKNYRWVVRVRSSVPSKYRDSEGEVPRIFSVIKNKLD